MKDIPKISYIDKSVFRSISPPRSRGNYSCNRAVIFEVAIFLLLSLFWTNHQPPSPPRQPPITFSTAARPRHPHDHHGAPATPPLQQPRHDNHNLHNHTTAFLPQQRLPEAWHLSRESGRRPHPPTNNICAGQRSRRIH